MRFIPLLGLLCLGCVRTYAPIANISSNDDLIRQVNSKRAAYCNLSYGAYFDQGFVDGECDSLLFTSLRGIGCNDINIEEFEGNAGRWYRSPKHDCLETGRANSDISQDMMIGLLTYLYWSHDGYGISRLISYGEEHYWKMGNTFAYCYTGFMKCIMSSELINIAYNIKSKLYNNEPAPHNIAWFLDNISSSTGFAHTDFRAHLQVLHILLNGSLYSGISGAEFEVLRKQAERQPNNALYQAAYHLYNDGDQHIAAKLLLDAKRFPADKLPTSDIYCVSYLYQRDEVPKDWEPCFGDKREEHYGTDLIFAAAVIDGTYMRGKGN